jgi:hypothetical protein
MAGAGHKRRVPRGKDLETDGCWKGATWGLTIRKTNRVNANF